MGLFDRKYCSICGAKIGLLGNRRLADGDMCKDCASGISPYLTGRKEYTVAEMVQHLDSRAQNYNVLQSMAVSDILGSDCIRFYFDQANRLWFSSRHENYYPENPDVFSYDMVTGCLPEIREESEELFWKDAEGHDRPYEPAEFRTTYNFCFTVYLTGFLVPSITYKLNDTSVEGSYCAEYVTLAGILDRLKFVFDNMAAKVSFIVPAAAVLTAVQISAYNADQQRAFDLQRDRMERFEMRMTQPVPPPAQHQPAPHPPVPPASHRPEPQAVPHPSMPPASHRPEPGMQTPHNTRPGAQPVPQAPSHQPQQGPHTAGRQPQAASPAGRPGMQSAGRPGSQPTGRPGSQPAGRQDAQPTGRPGSQAAGRPGPQAAGRQSAQPAGRTTTQREPVSQGRPQAQNTRTPPSSPHEAGQRPSAPSSGRGTAGPGKPSAGGRGPAGPGGRR